MNLPMNDKSLPLRERRRQQTMRELQLATLRLALRDGFDAVTTEAIAHEAGISHRTFFNYYPNKEMAALGQPPSLPREAIERFVASKGALITDLRELLVSLIDNADNDREIIASYIVLRECSVALRNNHEVARYRLQEEWIQTLRVRLVDTPPFQTKLLGSIMVALCYHATDLWVTGKVETAYEAVVQVWQDLEGAAGLCCLRRGVDDGLGSPS